MQTWNVFNHLLNPGGGQALETCDFLGVAWGGAAGYRLFRSLYDEVLGGHSKLSRSVYNTLLL